MNKQNFSDIQINKDERKDIDNIDPHKIKKTADDPDAEMTDNVDEENSDDEKKSDSKMLTIQLHDEKGNLVFGSTCFVNTEKKTTIQLCLYKNSIVGFKSL